MQIRPVFRCRQRQVYLQLRSVYLSVSLSSECPVEVTPKTAENFRGLCTGEYGQAANSKKKLDYAGTKIFRIRPGFMFQGGDFILNNGDGGESIYGEPFKDESFARRHHAVDRSCCHFRQVYRRKRLFVRPPTSGPASRGLLPYPIRPADPSNLAAYPMNVPNLPSKVYLPKLQFHPVI